jgi:hypothetical protein
MTSFRATILALAALFLVLVQSQSCKAQTTHNLGSPTAATINEFTVSDNGSGVLYSSGASGPVITQSGGGFTSVWNGQSRITCTSGYCYTTNGQDAETRPFNHKGPTLAQVDSSAVELRGQDVPSASYVALAKDVNLDAASGDEAQMLNTIFDHEFHVYNFEKVDNYLYRQALEKGAHMKWGWKPLRSQDLEALGKLGSVPADNGVIFQKQYARRVPARILEDVKCVRAEVEDAVFLVSDFEYVQPDPFLAISTPKLLAQGKLWIVDRWDEPTFDDGKPVKARLEARSKE